MSTHAQIGFADDAGNVISIECHFDGYIKHVGRILYNDFSNLLKISYLVHGGDVRALWREDDEKHNVKIERYEDHHTSPIVVTEDAYTSSHNFAAHYFYLFKNNQWYVRYHKEREWELLKEKV